jgi:hypothetical protein
MTEVQIPEEQQQTPRASSTEGRINDAKAVASVGIRAFARAMFTPPEEMVRLPSTDTKDTERSLPPPAVERQPTGSIEEMSSYELAYRISIGEITDPQAARLLLQKQQQELNQQTHNLVEKYHDNPQLQASFRAGVDRWNREHAPLITGSNQDLARHIATETTNRVNQGNWQTEEDKQAAAQAAGHWYELAGRLLASEPGNQEYSRPAAKPAMRNQQNSREAHEGRKLFALRETDRQTSQARLQATRATFPEAA